jgi:hypothetical protein
MKYPSDWSVNDSNINNGIIFKSPDGHGAVQVVIKNLTSYMTVGRFFLLLHLHRLDLEPGFRLLELNNYTSGYFLSGHPATRTIGIQNAPGVPSHDIKMMYYATELGSELYAIGYLSSPETYPNYLLTAQQMIDSFQIIKTQ